LKRFISFSSYLLIALNLIYFWMPVFLFVRNLWLKQWLLNNVGILLRFCDKHKFCWDYSSPGCGLVNNKREEVFESGNSIFSSLLQIAYLFKYYLCFDAKRGFAEMIVPWFKIICVGDLKFKIFSIQLCYVTVGFPFETIINFQNFCILENSHTKRKLVWVILKIRNIVKLLLL
jgi:hypothetical protein